MPPETPLDAKKLSRSQLRRRDDIIQASLKIFDRDGFETARMSDIAKEADVAKGTLYLYFDSKAALLEGVIETAVIPTLKVIEHTADTHDGTAKDRLINQIRITAHRIASPEMKLLVRYMMSGASGHERVTKFYYENVVQNGRRLFKETLLYGVECGEFKEEAANIDPLVLFGGNIYMVVWNNLFDKFSTIDVEKLVNDQMTMVLGGLLVKPE